MQFTMNSIICNQKYAKVCKKICKNMNLPEITPRISIVRKVMQNMQKTCEKYAKNMQKICIYPTNIDCKKNYAKHAKNMQKYAKLCKMCKHEICLQNMQKFALPLYRCWPQWPGGHDSRVRAAESESESLGHWPGRPGHWHPGARAVTAGPSLIMPVTDH